MIDFVRFYFEYLTSKAADIKFKMVVVPERVKPLSKKNKEKTMIDKKYENKIYK